MLLIVSLNFRPGHKESFDGVLQSEQRAVRWAFRCLGDLWVKNKETAGIGPQVLVHVGSHFLGYPIFDPRPFEAVL